MRALLIIVLLLPLSAAGSSLYSVYFDENLQAVTVDACFEGPAPRRLYRNDQAGRYTEWIRAGGRVIRTDSQSASLSLPDLPHDSCLSWRVNLDKAVAKGSGYRSAMRIGEIVLTSGDLWFWRDGRRNNSVSVEVRLPEGMSISTPWKDQPDSPGVKRFQTDSSPASWSSRVAVGRFAIDEIAVGGTNLRVAVLGHPDQAYRAKFVQWIGETGQTVSSVYGRFPQDSPQILIIPVGPRDEAVPWGQVLRGGGVATELYVDETRSLDQLREDWTATHELSHMLLPYVSRRDRWLSEGMASYYQNVLRARDGRLTEEQAWQKLNSGFERGRAGTSGDSLASASRSGRGATMRVYWSGAAMMLKADTTLRLLSNGRQSLDTALGELYSCCMANTRSWSARALFGELDRLTGTSVFAGLYEQHVGDDEFPDVSHTYEQLGLVLGPDSIKLDPEAPWARIRFYIMNG